MPILNEGVQKDDIPVEPPEEQPQAPPPQEREPSPQQTQTKAVKDVEKPAAGKYAAALDQPVKNYRLSKWYQDYLGSNQRARNLANNPPSFYADPPRMPNDAYKQMENYQKLTGFEQWLGNTLQSRIPQATENLREFLPDPIEKAVFGIGSAAMKFLSVFDFMEEGVERGSGLVRQYKLATENNKTDEFWSNIGDAWAAGNMFYDVSNTVLLGQDSTAVPWHTDLPGTSALDDLRKEITALTDQGVGRKEALEQVKASYYNDLGALSIRAIKQDIAGHILFSPFLIGQAMGYAPVDIVKKASIAAGNKYIPGALEHMEDALVAAKKADDLDEVARLTEEIATVKKTMDPITSGDKFYMFLTGNFPEPLEGAGKFDELLYFVGNQLAKSEKPLLKTWQKLNPFSLTPEARVHEWMNRIDDYLGTHVLAQADPDKIVNDLIEMASQATSGKVSAISVTSDGRVIQSFLRSAELSAETLLGDFKAVAKDGQLLMEISRRLGRKAPDLIDDIANGKSASIVSRLAGMGDDGARIASGLTDEILERLGKLKAKPYTPELFRRILHNEMLDQIAQVGIVRYGLKHRGLIQKWNSFLKAGETLAFLRMNPTFAARNWINNEFTMLARGVGGDFFGNGIDDLAKLTEKLNFSPLRANQSFTMAGMEADTLGEIGEKAGQTIAKQLEGDAIWLDKWAKAINKADLGPLDFGRLASRMEATASRKAVVKGYTRAWRKFWTPDNFTNAGKFLPQDVIREVGETGIQQLDDLLADASSIDDITNILKNIDDIDIGRSTSGIIREAEETLGVKLADQFEETEIEAIRDGLDRAMQANTRQEVRDIFDDLHEKVIKKISDESAAKLDAKVEKFANSVGAERGMALIDVTEELTNQLDVFEYLYSSGMARFRPMDVSKDVRDIYWPIWLEQQNSFWKVRNDRIDATVRGLQEGADEIGLNMSEALTKIKNKRKVWDNFFEWRNGRYEKFFDGELGELAWDELIEEVNARYISAAETDIAVIKDIDDILAEAVRINSPELADGFSGWRAAIREWKIKDRAHTRTYTYLQKTGELPPGSMSYQEFWQLRGQMQAELSELKQRGYGMMEGNADELAYFAGIAAPEDITEPSRIAKRIAGDLDGQTTTMRAGQALEFDTSPVFPNEAREEQWFGRNFWTLRELEESAAGRVGSPASRLDLSDYARGELEKFLNNAQREMSDAQYGSLRMAQYYRDSALLNYNRKMNYDTWLGTFMPYEFWMTHSMAQWAIQSINRPAALSFYMRLRELQNRIAIDDDSFPTRLKGKIKIQIPPWMGMQEWMGDSIFVDPMTWVAPFGQMTMPYQMAVQRGLSNEGAVERELDRMVQDGDITRAEADQAIATRSGQAWADAVAKMQEYAGERTDNYELLTALSSVHAPYDWAIKALKGKPEEIGPFLPATFTVNRLLGMFGVDAPHEKMNAPARIRRWMGLPGFDQWEDYRVERMLSNMSATGEITPDQASRAMIEHSGVAWELARKKAAKEYAGGPWWVTMLKTAGLQAYLYPEGEQQQRQLSDDFEAAMNAYEDGDAEAYNRFFDLNPEFANRLALWDSPEERMQKFMVGNIWDLYAGLEDVNKKIAREALGEEFNMRFLNKDTRNYDAIPTEQLQLWAKMLGGDPPGTLKDAFPIDFAPPEIATNSQIFYDTRQTYFPNYYELQNKYFDLAEGTARKNFLGQNPELKQYWEWRRDFLKRNPTIAPYIDDNFEPNYSSVKELERAYQEEPDYVKAEWSTVLGSETVRVITRAYNGEELPGDIVSYLEEEALRLGMTYEELLREVATAP